MGYPQKVLAIWITAHYQVQIQNHFFTIKLDSILKCIPARFLKTDLAFKTWKLIWLLAIWWRNQFLWKAERESYYVTLKNIAQNCEIKLPLISVNKWFTEILGETLLLKRKHAKKKFSEKTCLSLNDVSLCFKNLFLDSKASSGSHMFQQTNLARFSAKQKSRFLIC